MSVSRVIGITLVVISLLPIAALFVVYWVWARHMYTVGFSADAHGVMTLTALAFGDMLIFATGIYLTKSSG
jgi:hypothetical protein